MALEQFLPDPTILVDLQQSLRVRTGDFFDAPQATPVAALQQAAASPAQAAGALLTPSTAVGGPHAALDQAITNAISVLDSVQDSYENVAVRTRALYADCKSLAEEEARLRANVAQISELVAPYDAVYVLGLRLGLAVEGVTPAELQDIVQREEGGVPAPLDPLADPAGLAAVLDRIEAGIAFFTRHSSYKGAAVFLGKYRSLQARVLALLRSAATDMVGGVAAAAERELASRHGAPAAAGGSSSQAPAAGAAPSEANVVSALQLRWRNGLARLRPALRAVEARCADRSAAAKGGLGASTTNSAGATTLSLLESAALSDAALSSRRAYTDTLRGVYSLYFTKRTALVSSFLSGKLHGLTAVVLQGAGGVTGAGHAAVPDSAGPAVLTAVRSACVEVGRLVASEHELFHTLFIAAPDAPLPTHLRTAADAALSSFLVEVSSALPDTLRPLLLGVTSLDILCDVVDILGRDAAAELVTPRPQVMAPLGRVLSALVADLRERLTFLAQNYITDYIEADAAGSGAKGGARPALLVCPPGAIDTTLPAPDGSSLRVTSLVPGDATDYPAWMAAYVLRLRQQQASSSSASASSAPRVTVFDSWHPTLERALTLVSKLHRVLDRASFESLAQDAAAACATALARARTRVQAGSAAAHARGGSSASDGYWLGRVHATVAGADGSSAPAPPGSLVRGVFSGCCRLPLPPSYNAPGGAAGVTGAVDADLFFLRAVLTLREQLSPFDVHLSRSSRTLDFASTGEALASVVRGLVSGSTALRRLDAEAIVALISQGLPRVAEKQVDTKQELESLLKSACEAFIERAHALVSAPLEALPLAHPLPAAAVAAAEGAPEGDATPAAPSVTAEAAAAFFTAASASLSALLPQFSAMLAALRRRLGLYLLSPLTASILFKPVRERAATALSLLRSYVHEWSARAPSVPAGSPAAAARQAVDTALLRLSAVLDASDLLAVDPLSQLFGLDDSVLAVAASGGAAALEAAANAEGAAAAPGGATA